MTEEVSNKELEDWCDGFCKDFDPARNMIGE